MHELSRGLSIAPSTTTRLVEQMEKQGWVTRSADRSDRRRVMIHLLPAGEERAWALQGRARQELWLRSARLQAAGGMLANLDTLTGALAPND